MVKFERMRMYIYIYIHIYRERVRIIIIIFIITISATTTTTTTTSSIVSIAIIPRSSSDRIANSNIGDMRYDCYMSSKRRALNDGGYGLQRKFSFEKQPSQK